MVRAHKKIAPSRARARRLLRRPPLFDVLLQDACRPNAELRCAARIHPIPDRDNCVEIIKADPSGYLARPFRLNYREILVTCLAPLFELFPFWKQLPPDSTPLLRKYWLNVLKRRKH